MSYSGYPLKKWLKEKFSTKKSALLRKHGFFRTLSGGWYDGHCRIFDKQCIHNTSYDQLKKLLS
jgi:hypothetical protein